MQHRQWLDLFLHTRNLIYEMKDTINKKQKTEHTKTDEFECKIIRTNNNDYLNEMKGSQFQANRITAE